MCWIRGDATQAMQHLPYPDQAVITECDLGQSLCRRNALMYLAMSGQATATDHRKSKHELTDANSQSI